MLTRFDDYPIHQMPVPIAQTGTSDRNHYDRYFFNGYLPDGELFFAGAMGLYPNRRVIDGAFSVVHNGRQTNLYASGRAPVERDETNIGPIRVEIVKPMERIRLIVDAADRGIEADLTFDARAVAVEEERQTRFAEHVLVMDVTRFTQHGAWSGWLSVDGNRIDLTGRTARGTRDRSWGIRGVGEPQGGAPAVGTPQIFWLWAPLNFDDECAYVAIFDDAEGTKPYQHSLIAPVRTRPDDPVVDNNIAQKFRDNVFTIDWEPGTRRARAASLTLHPFGNGAARRIDLEVLYTFQMCGIGYSSPTFGHGVWNGELAVNRDDWAVAEVDPLQRHHLHIQNVCKATMDGKTGWGVLEQIAIGPHPTGLTGLLDPYRPS